MKKIVTIIILLLLCPLYAEPPYNYGEFWQSSSKMEKEMYLLGFMEGAQLFTVLIAYEANDDSVSYDQYAIRNIEVDIFAKTVNDYYNDPANTYIRIQLMAYIASAKIKGVSEKDLKERLERYRKSAFKKDEPKKED